uniref:Acrosin n=1 Tax=Culicoides sonorensis TaxID=179676 RepID=A0A336K7N4_CULSO
MNNMNTEMLHHSLTLIVVILLLFIHKNIEARVVFTEGTPLNTESFNSTSSSLDESLLTTLRYKRSGGFPKIPVQEKSTYFTARECGTRVVNFDPLRKGKIVGGTSTPYGAYPWQVEIQMFQLDLVKFVHHCGGAVIGKNLVLTAAHCLERPQIQSLRIVIGDHSLDQRDLHEHSYRVQSVLIHPDFRKDGPYSNDIAIIKLKAHGIGFNTHVRPICLPDPNESIPAGTICSVTGWGIQRAEDLKSLSSVLRVAAVPIMDTEMCRSNSINGGRSQKILDSMLCAGTTDGGMDACAGDSGGPLACEYNNKFYLTGLVSWGDGCAKKNRPGVYTRVESFINKETIQINMNTRKNRKRTWKVQESQEIQFDDDDESGKKTEIQVKDSSDNHVEAQKQQQQQVPDSKRLLSFLQSWQEAKEAQVKGNLRKDMPESISDRMAAKGFPISVNVARIKIMNFIKKYNLVKKMAAEGKPNTWSHFHTVKKILEFGPPILPTANVIIPMENIKEEEKVNLTGNTLKIAERKVSIDAQKSGAGNIDLIEIPDEDPHVLRPRVYFSESEPRDQGSDDTDDSELSDEDLDFENPLDKISFGFHSENGIKSKSVTATNNVLPPKMPKLEKKIKCPVDIDNHIKPTIIPNQKQNLAQIPAQIGPRPIVPKQQIIPIPTNLNLPRNMSNGAPQQYLIVRPLNPSNPGQTKTLAIPMGGQFKIGSGKPEIAQTTLNDPGKTISSPKKSVMASNHIKMLNIPKISAQTTTSNVNTTLTSGIPMFTQPLPPPLVASGTNLPNSGPTGVNGRQNANSSPCSSPGSSSSPQKSPSVRQLLSNVIQLETNIFNLQHERLQLERARFEMERDYGKEMINIFREIKDKLCDKISVPSVPTPNSEPTKQNIPSTPNDATVTDDNKQK